MERADLTRARADLDALGCRPDGEVFFTHSSLLWPVRRGAERLMLKVVDPDDDEAHATDVLRHYGGDGAVRVVAAVGPVQLLERIEVAPGVPTLEQRVLAGRDDEATGILCDVVERLHRRPAPSPPLEHLIPLRRRSDALRELLGGPWVPAIDQRWLRWSVDLVEDVLEETAATAHVLHGDLHHGNVLWGGERGWLAIDPKGLWGPRSYEYAALLCNPYDHGELVASPDRMARQAAIIAARADLDLHLLLKLTTAHALQCMAWSWEEPDRGYWVACAETAAGLAGLR